jgi:hypothetical protein
MTARRPGLLFIAACVAALALRLILPAGWMPVAGNDGVVISLCSGSGPVDPAVPASGGDAPCDYALALGPLLMTAALVLPVLMLPVLPVPLPAAVAPLLRRRRPRPPGQGPPAA